MNGDMMETCPACLGPNPDCATCLGAGEVTASVHAAFMADKAAREALWEFRSSVERALLTATEVDLAKATLADLISA